MFEEITFDQFTERRVSVKRQRYIEEDGIRYDVGKPTRTAYKNNTAGRTAIQADLSGTALETVMLLWGVEPLEADDPLDE